MRHRPTDWVMLLALTAMWGTAFLLTKVAVTALPPDWVVFGRLAIASVLLLPAALWWAQTGRGGARLWVFLVLIALFGNALPFSLITWGQQRIDSGLAGILMAVMPLFTLGLAHFFVPNERLTRYRVGGFALGFAGIVVLTGPEALTRSTGRSAELLAMLAVLGGAVCYAVSAILSRLRPASEAVHAAAATTALATLMMLPLTRFDAALAGADLPLDAVLAVAALGVFSTAVAAVVYFRLIHSAGPSFVSQLNYLIPLWAVALGIAFLGERPQPNHLYALGLILSGILLTHFESRVTPTPIDPTRERRDAD
ncbi:MAG: DMT family transporter [Thiotrichales bacterium]